MSRLKKVLLKEMKNILEGASDRPDRMVPHDSDEDRGTRWYETVEDFSRENETLEEAMNRVIAEEYVRYRDTSEQDIGNKIGLSEFEVEENENRDRWFEPDEQYGQTKLDEDTIKRATKRVVRTLKS